MIGGGNVQSGNLLLLLLLDADIMRAYALSVADTLRHRPAAPPSTFSATLPSICTDESGVQV
jgi:hypothetical protein